MPTDFFGRVMVVFQRYGMSMLQGAGVSIRIALVGTIVGCIIGFAVGIVQTIPVEAKDNPIKKAVLWVIKLIMNAYVEFFRGTPMMAQAMEIMSAWAPTKLPSKLPLIRATPSFSPSAKISGLSLTECISSTMTS